MKRLFTTNLHHKVFIAIFIVLLGMSILPARTVQAAVGPIDPWPAAPTQTATTGDPTPANFTVSAGTDRLLVVIIDCYDSPGAVGQTFSATYGGVALTQAVIQNSNRRQTWIGWQTLGNSATSTTALLAVSITGVHTNAAVWAAAYSGVDQSSPITGTKSSFFFNESKPQFITTMTVNAGGYSIYTWSSSQSRLSDTESYTEHGENNISGWWSGVASKMFITAGTTRPQVTLSSRTDVSLSFVSLNPSATVNPPSISKSFGAATIPQNGTTTLTFTITNPNTSTDLTGVSFTDNLPFGLVVATPNGLSGDCGSGTITATQATRTVSLSSATLAAESSCTFSINVTGMTIGEKTNSATVSSTNGGTGNTTNASITVVGAPAAIMYFDTKTIPLNDTAILNFEIDNYNDNTTLFDVAFTVILPDGLAVDTASISVCNGTLITTAPNSIALTDGILPPNGTCFFNLALSGTTAGFKQIPNSNITSINGGTGRLHGDFTTVVAPPSLSKSFTTSSMPLDSTGTITFTITNPNTDTALTGVEFTDYLFSDVYITSLSSSQCGGTLNILVDGIEFTNGTIDANSDCSFDVNFGAFNAGVKESISSNITSTNGGTGNTTYASIVVEKFKPSISTVLSSASINIGRAVYDSAILSGAYGSPAGTVTYTVYSDDSCTNNPQSAGTKRVYLGYVPNSDSITFYDAGTYYWQAVYSGDDNNESAASECTSEILVVEKLTPTVRTTIHDNTVNAVTSVVSGCTVHGSATVIGTPGYTVPTGSVTFAWYPNGTCTGTSSDAGTVSLDSGTAHPSTSQGPLAAGSYSFKASYNGDSIYETTESDCGPLIVSDYDGLINKELVSSNWAFSMPMDHIAIGEIVTYETTFSVPPGSIDNLILIDTLDAGLAYVSCESITGPTSYTCASIPIFIRPLPDFSALVNWSRQIELHFGTVNNSDSVAQDLTMRYRAIVLDSAENLRGKTLNNSSAWSWNSSDPDTPSTQAALPVSIVILEPSLAISKSISPTLIDRGGTADVTIVISHTAESNQTAFDVDWIDPLPAGLTYVPGSLAFSGQLPSSSNDASLPNLTATWDALTLSGGPATITFKVTVNMAPGTSATNSTAVAWTSLPGDFTGPQTLNNLLSHERFYDPASPVDIYTVSASGSVTVRSAALPATGFSPGRITLLEKQPDGLAYTDSNNLYLEIPTLHKFLKIVGVPQSASGWDVTWLGNQAGYLQGTAFPSWKGNSVITAHVYDANGRPGPFVDLASLRWGDRIIIHAYGTQYIYQVREVIQTIASDPALLRHEDYPWVTLVTCQGYDARSNSYAFRIGIRAVLIDSRAE